LILILQVNKEFWEEIMRIKLLVVLCLSAFLFLAGCRGNSNTNTNLATATATPTPVVKTSETAAVDTVLKAKIEDALKKKGFTNVTVDTSTTPATLRGTYPKGKLDEVTQTAQEAAGKPVKTSELTEAK
jgi:hypothetical protein